MKKISLLLSFVMLFSVFGFTAFAKAEIPVTAKYSYTENGDMKIVVSTSNVKRIVSLNVILSYDTSVYRFEDARPCVAIDSEGNESENLAGLWVFGELSDKSGCTGAFVSFDGVTKAGEIPVCEFVIKCESGEIPSSDITVSVKELITDDGDAQNDVFESVIIPLIEETVDASQIFEYSICDETVVITGVKSDSDVSFVPDLIRGLPVRSLVFEEAFESPFVVFGRSVLRMEGNVFSKNNTVIAPNGSAPIAAAKRSGAKTFSYNEDVKTDFTENAFYTHKYLVTNIAELFKADCKVNVISSHTAFESYLGTGTKITLSNNGKKAEFLLCVTGDVNGDSVCDVLDAVMVKGFVNKQIDLEKIQQKSVEFNGDGIVDANDYAQAVNVTLGEGLKVFDGVWGDLNGDYCVDILDLFSFNNLMNKNDLSEEETAKSDFNNDGITDKKDKEILNDLIEEFK